jgi:guanylate kinase
MPGKIFVITGPSGVGKGTLCERLLTLDLNLTLSISATSRPCRAHEQEGVNYFFKTREGFEALIEADRNEPDPEKHHLLEWAPYNDNYYGTPRQEVQAALASDRNMLLEIETQGALAVKRKFPEACLMFIAPPSFEELERRLHSRATDTDADILSRLDIAREELKRQAQFDYVFVNANLDDCLARLQAQIKALCGSAVR